MRSDVIRSCQVDSSVRFVTSRLIKGQVQVGVCVHVWSEMFKLSLASFVYRARPTVQATWISAIELSVVYLNLRLFTCGNHKEEELSGSR